MTAQSKPQADRPTLHRATSDRLFLGVLACFFLSGFAALLYQTAWMRQFSIVFGTAELAVAAVLAAYMAGLAVGAAFAARFLHRIRRPILAYGVLEAAIAFSALLLPLGLAGAQALYANLFGGQPDPPSAAFNASSFIFLAIAFVLLVIPTACMGATLPILARSAVHTRAQIGSRIGTLYAINTAGAVAGTLVAAFVLLPALGLRNTVWCGAAVNLIVFIIAADMSRSSPASSADLAGDEHAPAELDRADALSADDLPDRRVRWILPIMLVSGSLSFTNEVMWARLLGHVLGASVYAFATMLTCFLAGIAIGSAVAARYASTRSRAWVGFIIAQLGIAVCSAGVFLGFGRLPALAASLNAGEDATLATNLLLAVCVMTPATLFIGATFPFAVRLLARRADESGRTSGTIYAWNTVGAIIGALAAGFIVIPALQYAGTARLVVLINIALAVGVYALRSRAPREWLAGILITGAILALFFRPGPPEAMLRSSPLPDQGGEGRIAFYAVGRSATVLVLQRDGIFLVRSNGMSEAGVSPRGGVAGLEPERWLTALPGALRPNAESMLIVGLGGGVAVSGVPETLDTIHVIEIEPEIIAANRTIAEGRLDDPLQNPDVTLITNDARSALALTTRTYDIIVSQPSHPWTAGASHLYTREFMAIAHEHLSAGGMFVQWMDSHFVDDELFDVLVATLADVFDNVQLFIPPNAPSMLLFVASDDAIRIPDVESMAVTQHLPIGLLRPEDLLLARRLIASRDGERLTTLGQRPPNRDDRNVFATGAPRALRAPLGFRGVYELLAKVSASSFGPADPQPDFTYLLGRYDVTDPQLTAFYREFASIGNTPEAETRRALLAGDIGVLADIAERWTAQSTIDSRAAWLLVGRFVPDIVRSRADPSIIALSERLDVPHRAILTATRHAFDDNWDDVRAHESILAQIAADDPAYLDAARLRATWRVRVDVTTGDPDADAETVQTHGRDALRIVDVVMPRHMSWPWLEIRLDAGRRAENPWVIVETVDAMQRVLRASPDGRGRTFGERLRETVENALQRSGGSWPKPLRRRADEVLQSLK
jgi:spermidine synthase